MSSSSTALSSFKLSLLAGLASVGHSLSAFAAQGLAPCPPLPTADQLCWQNNDQALLVSFGITTFTGDEEGTGKEAPGLFNPTDFNPSQWAKLAKELGYARIDLTVKGHDGFCLWPTAQTDHSVKASPWKNGRGDAVKEFVAACRKEGLDVGFVLACEDRADPHFGTEAYNQVYLGELTELLTQYGPIAEFRFDGPGGHGEGAVGSGWPMPGARSQHYDWPAYFAKVKELQPHAIRVAVAGPDARWNGNNNGHSGELLWSPYQRSQVPGPEVTDKEKLRPLNSGDPQGDIWLPPECCVALRTRWFWHPEDDAKIIPLDRLISAYFKSVGRGATLLLDVPADRRGMICDADIARLRQLKAALDTTFARDLLLGKTASASSVRPGSAAYAVTSPQKDGNQGYWAPEDTDAHAPWIEFDFGKPTIFNTSALEEPIALGQRISAYSIEIPDSNGWKIVLKGKGVGHLKLERFDAVTASKVRFVIDQSRAVPALSRASLYFKAP